MPCLANALAAAFCTGVRGVSQWDGKGMILPIV